MKTEELEKILGKLMLEIIKENKEIWLDTINKRNFDDNTKRVSKYNELLKKNMMAIDLHNTKKPLIIFKKKYKKWKRQLMELYRQNDVINDLFLKEVSNWSMDIIER